MGWRLTVGTLFTLCVLIPNVVCLPSLLAGFKPASQHHHSKPSQVSDPEEVERPEGDVIYDENADRSYKFDFDGDDFSRNEEADSDGHVTGNYRFVDNDGQERSVSYKAGAGIGFVAEGDFINQDSSKKTIPEFGRRMSHSNSHVQGSTYSGAAPAISILPPASTTVVRQSPRNLNLAAKQNGGYPAPVANPQKFYSRPQKTPEAVNSPVQQNYDAAESSIEENQGDDQEFESPPMVMDASYSFSYDNDLAARVENADQAGNVNGQYTYVNSEGNLIQVKYSAGAEKGFVIDNEEELSQAVDKATIDGNSAALEQTDLATRAQKRLDKADITFVGPNIDDSTWIQDRTYSFGFRGQESSRSEMSDENGNVRGTYTIPDTQGLPILVRYTAGPKKGFVIENIEEVQRRTGQLSGYSNAPPLPENLNQSKPKMVVRVAPKSASPMRPQQQGFLAAQKRVNLPTQSQSSALDIRQNVQTGNGYTSSSGSDVTSSDNSYNSGGDWTNSDKSYNFEFGLSDNRRKEVADESGNVRGQYGYTTAEGNQIQVTYSAGPNKGFVIENQKDLTRALSKATLDGATALQRARSQDNEDQNQNNRMIVRKGERRNPAYTSSRPELNYLPPTQAFESLEQQSEVTVSQERQPITDVSTTGESTDESNNGQWLEDASFSFSVDSIDSMHQEMSDATGERQGSYSYISPEGKNVVVRYRAGREGFVILNPDEVLPKNV